MFFYFLPSFFTYPSNNQLWAGKNKIKYRKQICLWQIIVKDPRIHIHQKISLIRKVLLTFYTPMNYDVKQNPIILMLLEKKDKLHGNPSTAAQTATMRWGEKEVARLPCKWFQWYHLFRQENACAMSRDHRFRGEASTSFFYASVATCPQQERTKLCRLFRQSFLFLTVFIQWQIKF